MAIARHSMSTANAARPVHAPAQWLRFLLAVVALGLLAACGGGSGDSGNGDPDQPEVAPVPGDISVYGADPSSAVEIQGLLTAPNILLVRFKPGVTALAMATTVVSAGGEVVGQIPPIRTVQARFAGDWTEARVAALMASLESLESVSGVTTDALMVGNSVPCPSSPEAQPSAYVPCDQWPVPSKDPTLSDDAISVKWDGKFNTGVNWRLKALRAEQAWELLHGSARDLAPVWLGVADGKFRGGHEDLPNLLDISQPPKEEDPDDPVTHNHGMHVAGIIGAVGDNPPNGGYSGRGISGVVWKDNQKIATASTIATVDQPCKLALRFCVDQTLKYWDSGFMAAIANLLKWRDQQPRSRVRAVNFSAGYLFWNCEFPSSESPSKTPDGYLCVYPTRDKDKERLVLRQRRERALDILQDMNFAAADVLLVQSAGNSVLDAGYVGWAASALWIDPTLGEATDLAQLRNKYEDITEIRNRLIVVGATQPMQNTPIQDNATKLRATWYSDIGPSVEVWAPGGSNDCGIIYCLILSTGFGSDGPLYIDHFGANPAFGTSQAAPHITGLAGLVWQVDSGFTAAEVKDLILQRDTCGNKRSALPPEPKVSSPGTPVSGIVADAAVTIANALACRPMAPIARIERKEEATGYLFDASSSSSRNGVAITEQFWSVQTPEGVPIASGRGAQFQLGAQLSSFVVSLKVRDAIGSASIPSELPVTVASGSPRPRVLGVTPATMTADGIARRVTISGSGFTANSVVQYLWAAGPGAGVWTPSRASITARTATTIQVPINPGMSNDSIAVRVCRSAFETIDADCSIESVAVTVTAARPAGADLSIANIALSKTSVATGGSLNVTFDVRNAGIATAGASRAVVRLNQSATSAAGDNLASVGVDQLAPGASTGITLGLTAPTIPGAYRLWVLADNDNTAGQPIEAVANDIVLFEGILTVADTAPLATASLVASRGFTCGVTNVGLTDGTGLNVGGAKCWGFGGSGALGNGSNQSSLTPAVVVGLSSGVIAMAAGTSHTCAITSTGAVKCWGTGPFGELGDGTGQPRLSPVDVFGLGGGATAIAAGFDHSCAVAGAGAVKCWGGNPHGEIGDGTQNQNRLVPVNVLGLSTGVSAVSAGAFFTCALTNTGGVKCWGINDSGQLGDGTSTERLSPVDVLGLTAGVIAISAGSTHVCALTTESGVKCWGSNSQGQLGRGDFANSSTPVNALPPGSGATALSAGAGHTCAVIGATTVKCWGAGPLGDGTQSSHPSPAEVPGLAGIAAVAAGEYHTCATTAAGVVSCWGANGAGQLGDGTTVDRPRPTAVTGF